jgi:putative flippase GtrA
MRRQISMLLAFLDSQKGRYLFVGGFNTAVNFVISAVLYQKLTPHINFVLVGIIVNVLTISISFTTQKLIVFRTKAHWLYEYLRSYAVYGSSAVLGIGLMWILLHLLHLNVWLAQALVTMAAVVISYIGHTAFTFRERKHHAKQPSALSPFE